jgi:hypothetical protein
MGPFAVLLYHTLVQLPQNWQILSKDNRMDSSDSTLAAQYIAAARHSLAESLAKIRHCFDQLDDSHMGWRPFPEQNSLTNIILHLCGNIRQWIVCPLTGATDARNRPAEFSQREALPKQELMRRLAAVIEEADRALASLQAATLPQARRIQAYDTTVLAAIFNSTSHLVGHTHQIVFITRWHLREKYKFHWAPKSVEQGAPKPGQ